MIQRDRLLNYSQENLVSFIFWFSYFYSRAYSLTLFWDISGIFFVTLALDGDKTPCNKNIKFICTVLIIQHVKMQKG